MDEGHLTTRVRHDCACRRLPRVWLTLGLRVRRPLVVAATADARWRVPTLDCARRWLSTSPARHAPDVGRRRRRRHRVCTARRSGRHRRGRRRSVTIPFEPGDRLDVLQLRGRIPEPELRHLALLGPFAPLTAARAAELGFVDEIVPHAVLRRRGRALLRVLARRDERLP
jgi:hypothetical protein